MNRCRIHGIFTNPCPFCQSLVSTEFNNKIKQKDFTESPPNFVDGYKTIISIKDSKISELYKIIQSMTKVLEVAQGHAPCSLYEDSIKSAKLILESYNNL